MLRKCALALSEMLRVLDMEDNLRSKLTQPVVNKQHAGGTRDKCYIQRREIWGGGGRERRLGGRRREGWEEEGEKDRKIRREMEREREGNEREEER